MNHAMVMRMPEIGGGMDRTMRRRHGAGMSRASISSGGFGSYTAWTTIDACYPTAFRTGAVGTYASAFGNAGTATHLVRYTARAAANRATGTDSGASGTVRRTAETTGTVTAIAAACRFAAAG